jgi:hypothetical protein
MHKEILQRHTNYGLLNHNPTPYSKFLIYLILKYRQTGKHTSFANNERKEIALFQILRVNNEH